MGLRATGTQNKAQNSNTGTQKRCQKSTPATCTEPTPAAAAARYINNQHPYNQTSLARQQTIATVIAAAAAAAA
jgi:hypothetical protein